MHWRDSTRWAQKLSPKSYNLKILDSDSTNTGIYSERVYNERAVSSGVIIVMYYMLQYNCWKNFNNAPRQIRRTTVKPLLLCGQKRWKRKVNVKQRFLTRGEEVPWTVPENNNKTRKKKEVTSKSGCRRKVTIFREKLK